MRHVLSTCVIGMLAYCGVVHAGERITLVEHASNETTVDVGARGDSPGDLLVFANPVFDSANRAQLGADQGYCVRVVPGKSWECTWTLSLRNGMISCHGTFTDSGDSMLVISGGTGKYLGARGTVKVHSRDAKSTEYDFTYELL